jgi:hypothetical protein
MVNSEAGVCPLRQLLRCHVAPAWWIVPRRTVLFLSACPLDDDGRMMRLISFKRRSPNSTPCRTRWRRRCGRSRTRRDGPKRVQVAVGKPQPVPGDERETWFCPVYIDAWMSQVRPWFGEGPMSALMNALKLVQGFRDHVADIQIHAAYGTNDRPRSHRGRDRKTKHRSRR